MLRASLARKASFPCQFEQCVSLKDSLSTLNEKPIDLVLLSSALPATETLFAIDELRTKKSFLPILVYGAQEDPNFSNTVVRKSAQFYALSKTMSVESLEDAIHQGISRVSASDEKRVQLVPANQKETQSERIKTFAARLQGMKDPALMTDRILQVITSEQFGALPSGLAAIFAELRHNNFKTLKMINQLLAIYEYEIDTHSMETSATTASPRTPARCAASTTAPGTA